MEAENLYVLIAGPQLMLPMTPFHCFRHLSTTRKSLTDRREHRTYFGNVCPRPIECKFDTFIAYYNSSTDEQAGRAAQESPTRFVSVAIPARPDNDKFGMKTQIWSIQYPSYHDNYPFKAYFDNSFDPECVWSDSNP